MFTYIPSRLSAEVRSCRIILDEYYVMRLVNGFRADLFHRVIVHSGAANHPMSFTSTVQAQERFWNFQQHTSCLRTTVQESVACLKAIPQNTLKYLEQTFTVCGLRYF